MNVAPVSHRVALCGEFPTEVGKTPTDRLSSPVSGVFRTEKDRAVYAGLRSFDRVEREAGERVGAFVGTRLGSQRTATPTAQGFLRVFRPIILRCRKMGLVGYHWCQIIPKSPYCKEKTRCQARCQIQKGWFAHWITNKNEKKR